jgi:hypothetical protein
MNTRNLIFGAVIGGAVSAFVIKRYDNTHEKKVREIICEKFRPLLDKLGFRSPSETVTKEIEDGLNTALTVENARKYIDYSGWKTDVTKEDSNEDSAGNGNCDDCSNSGGRSESGSGECSCEYGSETDREHVAKRHEQCFDKTYNSMEEARADNPTANGIQLVANPELAYDLLSMVDGETAGDGTVLEELRCQQIEKINAVDFTKAIAAGSAMQSLIFDPIEKKLYWNFTYSEIEENDIYYLIGKDNWEGILDESGFNANGWIQPLYLHDTHDDVYIKVETGSASLK